MRWVQEFSEGSREQRELLGGKGAGRRRDDPRARSRAGPGGLHDHHRGVRRLHAGRSHVCPRASTTTSTRRSRALERATGKRLGDPDRPAAGLGAFRRPRVDARDARHGAQPRPQRRVGRGPRRQHRRASASPGTPTGGSCRCSATSSAGSPPSAFERGAGAGEGREAGAAADTDLDAEAAARADDARFGASVRGGDRRAVPGRAPRAAAPGDHRRVRLVGRRAGGRVPADQRHPRRLGDRGQRAADGVRQPRRAGSGSGRRRSAATSAPASRAHPATSSPTPRARTSSPAPATRRTSRRWPSGCPRRTPQLLSDLARLEAHYKDMQDVEFTIEEGRLFLLQTRTGQAPRAGRRALRRRRGAEGLLTREEALLHDRRRGARRAPAPRLRPVASTSRS